jgi:hypothetical protein
MMRRILLSTAVLASLTGVVFAVDLPNPLAKAKVGSWCTAKMTNAFGGKPETSNMYAWVTKVEGDKVTASKQELKADGKTATAPAETVDATAQFAQYEQKFKKLNPTVTEETLEINGKKVKCTKVEASAQGMTETDWFSAEIPVTGVAKCIAKAGDKEVLRLEVIDFGETGGAEKPTN